MPNLTNEMILNYSFNRRDFENFKFEISELESLTKQAKTMRVFKCENCEASLDIENVCIHQNGNLYCKECAEKLFVVCSCGRSENKKNMLYVEDIGSCVCRNCYSQMNVKMCRCCSKFFRRITRVNGFDYVCDKCFVENHFFRCCSCGSSFQSERYGKDDLCITCANNRVENSRNYTFKPNPKFFQNKNEKNEIGLFYGVELEMGDAPKYQDVVGFINETVGGVFYAKKDASIPAYGCEIVTHPATLAYHIERAHWEVLLEQAKKFNLKSDELDKCGVHIHISRGALSSKSCSMLDYFINDKKDFWKKIARRESHYSAYVDKNMSSWGRQTTDRHCAVNLSNENTIEIRIFKGTLNKDYLFSYLEVCDALINFVKLFDDNLYEFQNKGNLVDDFVKFFMGKYPYLTKYYENILSLG